MKLLDFLLTFGAVISFVVAVYLFTTDPSLAQTEEEMVDKKIVETVSDIKGQVSKGISQIKPASGTKAEAKPVAAKSVAMPVAVTNWRYIVIHHSATNNGSAKIFDRYHREEKGLADGLAYHFVIGNGTASKDGLVETGCDCLLKVTRHHRGASRHPGHVGSDGTDADAAHSQGKNDHQSKDDGEIREEQSPAGV